MHSELKDDSPVLVDRRSTCRAGPMARDKEAVSTGGWLTAETQCSESMNCDLGEYSVC